MKRYSIKPEYYDLWGTWQGNDIVTEEQIKELSREWEKPISELMEQVNEIEEATITKKIYSCQVIDGQMGEIVEADQSIGWYGDVEAYLYNALGDVNIKSGIPGDILQNFGDCKNIENICTLYADNEPLEVWFAAD